MSRKNALGRGLDSLLPATESVRQEESPFFHCPIDAIAPNPYQPRKEFDPEGLQELADSIREKGVIQPLIVLKNNDQAESFLLITGERRWRASRLAGLTEVPVVLKDAATEDLLEMALIENIQRQDLNPLEEAEAYNRLINELGLTQEETAKRVGKERSTVTNMLRLLRLPEYAKSDLVCGTLSMGHARALLSLADDEIAVKALRDEIIANDLSVRQTEALIKENKKDVGKGGVRKKKASAAIPLPYCRALANALGSYMGARTRIVQNGTQGTVHIEYTSPVDLERILGLIMKGQENFMPDGNS